MRLKTFYAFLILLVSSWILEFVLGIIFLRWYWGTAWMGFGQPGQKSMAEEIASVFNAPPLAPHFTPAGVVAFWVWVFVAVHVVFALRFGILAPFLERWRLGARRPSTREREAFNQAYEALRANTDEPISQPRKWRVADGMGLQSRWIGYVLIIDRELLKHRFFPAMLAHELGHANSEDRLARRLYAMLPQPVTISAGLAGLAFATGHVLLYPLWSWYWKARIYDADAFAARCGQGNNLLNALEFYQKLDKTTKGGRLLKQVPYVEQRIDRLQQQLDM